jgi:Peptidase family C25
MPSVPLLILSNALIHDRYKDAYQKNIHKNSVWKVIAPAQITIKAIHAILEQYAIKVQTILLIYPKNNNWYEQLPPVIGTTVISTLPYEKPTDIESWFLSVKNYPKQNNSSILASMQKPFYIKWAKRFYTSLKKNRQKGYMVLYKPPETTTKNELAHLFAQGFCFCIYTGHGRSRGWSGYRGFRWQDVNAVPLIQVSGVVLSLSCSAFKQERKNIPFATQWVLSGRLNSFCGFANAVHIQPLITLSNYILAFLETNKQHKLHQLVLYMHKKVMETNDASLLNEWNHFCIVGNPLIRIC